MFKKISMLYLICFSCIAYGMVTPEQIAACAKIKGDLSRLDCYDMLARPQKTLAPKTSDRGRWIVETIQDPIDDSKKVTAVLNAKKGISHSKKRIFFVARCQNQHTDAYIVWHDVVGISDIPVLTRFGHEKASTSLWNGSSDKLSTFNKSPIQLLTKMMQSNQFIAQTSPTNAQPVTAIFDTSGMKKALQPIFKTCKP